MSLLHEARLHTFQPLTVMEDQPVAVIRPMVYVPEKEIIHAARKFSVPVVKNPCPVDGQTERQEMKESFRSICRFHPRYQDIPF